MTRLVRAEITRWLARRGLWVTVGAGVAIALLVVSTLVMSAKPPSAAEVSEAQRFYQEAHDQWAQHAETDYQECIESVPVADQSKVCSQIMEEPKKSDWVPQPLSWADGLKTSADFGAFLGGLLALILGASFWGAEYRQGTVSTWLTFVPDRTKVWAARFVVLIVAGVLATALIEALLMGAAAVSVIAFQGSGAVGASGAALAVAARGLGFGAFMATLGGALAVLTRTTIAATAIPIGYLFLQSLVGLISSIPGFDKLALWLPDHNIAAYLDDGTTVTIPFERATETGMTIDYIEKTIPFAQGLAYLVVAVGLFAVASLLVFRRRDVT